MIARANHTPRWAMSFADLCLVLLAFLLLLQANRGNPGAVGAGIRAAFGAHADPHSMELPAAPLFEPGEAILRPRAQTELTEIGRAARARGAAVRIDSQGRDDDVQRFDGWELSAARAAAVARAIHAGGLDASRIDLSVGGTRETDGEGQRLKITTDIA